MSQDQHWQTVGQWQEYFEGTDDLEWERREKKRIQQLEELAESAQSRDDE